MLAEHSSLAPAFQPRLTSGDLKQLWVSPQFQIVETRAPKPRKHGNQEVMPHFQCVRESILYPHMCFVLSTTSHITSELYRTYSELGQKYSEMSSNVNTFVHR